MAYHRKLLASILMLAALGLSARVQAADAIAAPRAEGRIVEALGPNCQRIWTCHGDLCQWRRVCWHGCPDRYSCSPLYGAYGPYGGPAYWGAYSYGDLRQY